MTLGCPLRVVLRQIAFLPRSSAMKRTGVVAACEVLKRVRNGGNTAVNGHPRDSNTVAIYAYYRPIPVIYIATNLIRWDETLHFFEPVLHGYELRRS